MKALKWILLSIVSIIAVLLFIAVFVEKEYSVEREIVINKPTQTVYDYVVLLKNQNNYSKWASTDPNMEKTYQGVDGTVGFVSAWKSEDKNVGVGEQEITKIDAGKRIEYELRFTKPMEDKNMAYMTVDSISENQTKVKWGFNGRMSYPSNLMLLFLNFDKMLGGDFEYGLSQLKSILENE